MTSYRINFFQQVPKCAYYEVDQIHSNIICPISEIKNSPALLSGDGIFWHDNDLEQNESIAIKTADCLSILVHNGSEHYLIHAGWRGIYNGILRQINNFNEVIFYPSIMSCCFEVTDEFLQHFPSSRNFSKIQGKLYFNLQAEAVDQLKKSQAEEK